MIYADLQHPPAPPLPAELVPVQYATVKKQTDNAVTTQSTEDEVIVSQKPKEPVYADLHHSTNPPAPPLPAELVPVQYATVKRQTDNAVTTQSTEDEVIVSQKPKEPVYADLHHSTNPPAPPLPAELQCSTRRE